MAKNERSSEPLLFTVVAQRSAVPTKARRVAFLIKDNWDDWRKFRTQFFLIVFDDSGLKHEPGQVKIGQFNLKVFPQSRDIGAVTGKNKMIKLYLDRMVKPPGRPIYDKLFNAPLLRRCPLCGIPATVATLDHHLPKTDYSVLAITPFNLIPSCNSCQFSKKEFYALTAEDQRFHPYYNKFEAERWLRTEVVHSVPASFLFSADPPAWGENTKSRLLFALEQSLDCETDMRQMPAVNWWTFVLVSLISERRWRGERKETFGRGSSHACACIPKLMGDGDVFSSRPKRLVL